jgi:hypothetical protein
VRVLLLQLDGKLPNIALMRIAAHHRDRGDKVLLDHARQSSAVERGLWDQWDKVYASLIFEKTRPLARRLLEVFPDAVIGGSGWDESVTVEQHGITTKRQDYSDYPSFRSSIGFTQRGCRFDCWFCKVPRMEGKVRAEQSIRELWRGEPWPRELLLLDNDFFGQKGWRELVEEIRQGGFKVSFNQGINARVLSEEAAAAIASLDYRDDGMKVRRIYTAWDGIGDEGPLFRGLNRLQAHGVNPDAIMVYMLIGAGESAEDREYRRKRLREFGCRPYPMPYTRTDETRGFQRWVIGAYDKRIPWDEWVVAGYEPRRLHRRESELLEG